MFSSDHHLAWKLVSAVQFILRSQVTLKKGGVQCVSREGTGTQGRGQHCPVFVGALLSPTELGVLVGAGERGCGSSGGRTCLSLRNSSCVSCAS